MVLKCVSVRRDKVDAEQCAMMNDNKERYQRVVF